MCGGQRLTGGGGGGQRIRSGELRLAHMRRSLALLAAAARPKARPDRLKGYCEPTVWHEFTPLAMELKGALEGRWGAFGNDCHDGYGCGCQRARAPLNPCLPPHHVQR